MIAAQCMSVAAQQTVSLGLARYSADPVADATALRNKLASALVSIGWIAGDEVDHTALVNSHGAGVDLKLAVPFEHAQTHLRRSLDRSVARQQVGSELLEFVEVSLSTDNNVPPCTAGL
jgi:hypothetical protein